MTTTPATPGTGLNLSHRQILVIFSGLLSGMLLAALDQTIVATALPRIVSDLGGLDHLSWVVTAYLLTSTASTPLYGKISDLYGRKIVFQAAIVVFLVGSVLSGLAQSMNELIAFRAVQGLGAGGLMTMALTIIGDVVSPRERGRYQGYFGSVFAVASVAGPLIGGFFTDGRTLPLLGVTTSWRWIFYLNVPIGVAALVITSVVLNLPFPRREHAIDYPGAALMVAGVTALLLVTVWGGTQYPWGSPTIVGLAVAGVALLGVFLWWESRVAEPILPPRLFGNSVFSVSSALMFVMAFAMFGAVIFLPVYLQLVHGVTATTSGLLLLPLMTGVFAASVTSGRVVSRIGRYRIFPIAGTVLMTAGMWLLSYLGAHTPFWKASAFMLVAGAGMGMIMPITMLAVQNAVPVRELGVATSAVGFFRSMGGAFGTAVFGAILTARLHAELVAHLGRQAAGRFSGGGFSVEKVHAIAGRDPQLFTTVIESFVRALHVVFLTAVPMTVIGFLLALLLREVRLRDTTTMRDVARAAPGGGEEQAAYGAAVEQHGRTQVPR